MDLDGCMGGWMDVWMDRWVDSCLRLKHDGTSAASNWIMIRAIAPYIRGIQITGINE